MSQVRRALDSLPAEGFFYGQRVIDKWIDLAFASSPPPF
jgi:hypothetical protein